MKKVIFLVLALVIILGAAVVIYPKLKAEYIPETPVGSSESSESQNAQIAPDFSVLDAEVGTVSLSDYFGKPIVVNFWATWCGPCKSELPGFDSAYAQYGEDISFLMVNMTDGSRDTVDGTKGFVEEEGYTFPVYFDTELSAAYAYGVRSIPMTVFINADGTLMDYCIGAINEGTLLKYIEKMTEKN